MDNDDDKPDQYPFAPAFERAVVVLACTKPRFYGRIAYALDPACLRTFAGQLALQQAHAVNQDRGSGPAAAMIVIQRLHRQRHEGKVTMEQIAAVVDMFDDAEDAGLPDEESVVAELTPVLQDRLRDQATRAVLDARSKNKDLSKAVALEQQAARIGVVDTSIGTIVGDASFVDIRALRKLTRLRTGIMELDVALNGGLQRAGLGVLCGGSGDGKSMGLSHIAGVSACDGHLVGCVSLELPRAIWNARAMANMTGIPIDALLADPLIEERALKLLAERQGGVGCCVVQQMPAQGTTCEDIFSWVANVEHALGRKMTVLIVDYMDKLSVPPRKGKDVGSYDAGKIIAEGLRGFAEDRNMWMWTASQSQGRSKKSKVLDLGDTAESMNKPRVSDLWITLNVTDEQEEISFFIAKHRTAKARFTVGPLPTEFEVGRLAPIMEAA